ncbi:MAG TPA: type IV toxin-antitoxin system AbiEi family antitoxin domain-containing protein [Conexibacter sp.]|nr:type IV toxin-antitoxin system AbiEi family antitoxin domain-containing protein [Conexibacter sp.]
MSIEHACTQLERFGDRPFRVAEAIDAGVPRYELYRLRERGEVINVGRGVFRRAGSALSSSTDLATVCARVPHGAICLNSALAYWDLTDELPASVHLAVARGSHRSRIENPPTVVHVFAAGTFDVERREETTETGELLRIYSPERAVVDAMRLAHHVGRDTALHALNRYLRRQDAQPRKLVVLARELGGRRRLTDALEAVLS